MNEIKKLNELSELCDEVMFGYQKVDRAMDSIRRKMIQRAEAGDWAGADTLMKKNNALVPKRKSKADSAMLRWSKSGKTGPARSIHQTDWD